VGNYVYTIDVLADFIVVLDVSDPTTPSIYKTITSAYSQPSKVFVQDNYLYVGSYDGFTIAVYDLDGTKLTTLLSGNMRTTDLVVDNDTRILGRLTVATGAQVNNSFAVMSNMTVHDDLVVKSCIYPRNIGVLGKSMVCYTYPGGVVYTETFAGLVDVSTMVDCRFMVENPLVTKTSNVMLTLVGEVGEVRVGSVYDFGYEVALGGIGDGGVYRVQYLIL